MWSVMTLLLIVLPVNPTKGHRRRWHSQPGRLGGSLPLQGRLRLQATRRRLRLSPLCSGVPSRLCQARALAGKYPRLFSEMLLLPPTQPLLHVLPAR